MSTSLTPKTSEYTPPIYYDQGYSYNGKLVAKLEIVYGCTTSSLENIK